MINDIKEIDRQFDAIWENLRYEANNAIKWIKEFLSTCENNSFIMTDEEGYADVCVPYDGGNHPEYNSDMFAEVFSVYLANGEVYLEIDEESQYNITRLDSMHKIEIALEVAKKAGMLIKL